MVLGPARALLPLLLGLGLLAGCNSGADNPDRASGERRSGVTSAPVKVFGKDATSYLYVQRSGGGRLRRTADDRYELRLRDVDPNAVFFTDRPRRDTGVVPLGTMLGALFQEGSPAPNAALEFSDRSAGVVALELSDPRYDRRARTLTYVAKPLDDLTRPALRHYRDRLAEDLPRSFGENALFVDSFGGDECHGTLVNSSSNYLEVQSASKWSTDSWQAQPIVGETLEPNGATTWWESDGGFSRGCHNEVTFTVSESANGPSLGTVTATLDKQYKPFAGGTADCTSSTSAVNCERISFDPDKGGLVVEATWSIGDGG